MIENGDKINERQDKNPERLLSWAKEKVKKKRIETSDLFAYMQWPATVNVNLVMS